MVTCLGAGGDRERLPGPDHEAGAQSPTCQLALSSEARVTSNVVSEVEFTVTMPT